MIPRSYGYQPIPSSMAPDPVATLFENKWRMISDLDKFLVDVYSFYENRGFRASVLKGALNLLYGTTHS